MRHFSLVLAVFLLGAVTATATDISMGFKAGLAMSNQDFKYQIDLGSDPDYRLGFQGGAFVETPLTSNISLQANVQYVPCGFKAEFEETTEAFPEGTGRIITVKPRVDYISIPLLIKARQPAGQVTPYLIAGPRVNFQVGINETFWATTYDFFKKVSFGFTVGGGTEVQVSPKAALLFEVTYSPDLTNIFDAEKAKSTLVGSPVTLESVKNRTVSILAGVRF